MIKKTLYISNPVYISVKESQLVVSSLQKVDAELKCDTEMEKKYKHRENIKNDLINRIPIEDVGIVVLDNPQILITHYALDALIKNNSSLVTCNSSHMPSGLFLPLEGNNIQTQIFQYQIESTEPLKKQLWAQTISAKILNQKMLLDKLDVKTENMKTWIRKVRSGDPDNYEGRAAAYYWKNLFGYLPEFRRDRYGEPPNNLLNYGYAILRAITARGLVGSGLLPTFGIHHSNKYNAYCLADDIMEPYRPFVDEVVLEIVSNGEDFYELNTSIKKQLLSIGTLDVTLEGKRSPLMIAVQRTTASLVKCFTGEARKIIYPIL